PAVCLASGVLAGEKAHAQKRLHLRLDEVLQVLLDGGRAAGKLRRTAVRKPKQPDITHYLPLFRTKANGTATSSRTSATTCSSVGASRRFLPRNACHCLCLAGSRANASVSPSGISIGTVVPRRANVAAMASASCRAPSRPSRAKARRSK